MMRGMRLVFIMQVVRVVHFSDYYSYTLLLLLNSFHSVGDIINLLIVNHDRQQP